MEIDDALRTSAKGPLRVRGFLIGGDQQSVRLCTALYESYPPQCAEPSVPVEGLDLDQLRGLTAAEGIIWSDGPVELVGVLKSGVLRVTGPPVDVRPRD